MHCSAKVALWERALRLPSFGATAATMSCTPSARRTCGDAPRPRRLSPLPNAEVRITPRAVEEESDTQSHAACLGGISVVAVGAKSPLR